MSNQPYNIKFSQNFIKSEQLSEEIVGLAGISNEELVIEIGPGQGALTEFIVSTGAKVIAVEKDEELAENLKKIYQDKNIEIVKKDFLDFQLPNRSYKVIGNIPFALTTRIINRILNYENPPELTLLIMQKEAALRFIENNLISLKYKPWFKFKIIKYFRPEDFKPRPSVLPVLLKISKREFPLIEFKERENYLAFITFCFLNSKFWLRSSLRKIFSFRQLAIISQKYNVKKKPSELGLEQWISLFNEYQKYAVAEKKNLVENFLGDYKNSRKPNKEIFRTRAIYK